MGNTVILPIQAVSLCARFRQAFGHRAGRAILRIAGVDITLTAISGFKIENLLRIHFPGDDAVNIFVAYPFVAGGVFRPRGRVNIPAVGIGFIQVAVQTHRQRIAGQRPAQAKVGASGGPFIAAFRLVGV